MVTYYITVKDYLYFTLASMDIIITTILHYVATPRCLPETDAVWGIHWPVTYDGDAAVVACPGPNVTSGKCIRIIYGCIMLWSGKAVRTCNITEWLPADVSNCISLPFLMIKEQVSKNSKVWVHTTY